MPLRWLYLDLNSFFAACEQQENPVLRGKPVAVVPMMADTTCALAASYEAKRYGVKTGTLVAEARRLCPGIRFVQSRHRTYIEYHHRVLEAVESCIPIERVCSIDEMACRLTSDQQRPEVAIRLAHAIKRAVRERAGECLTSSIGIAPNRLLAKLASDMQKPDGLTLLEESDLPQKLLPLRLRDFCGIGPRMERRFHRHGVFTVEEMWRLSAAQMRAVWGGVAGLAFHAQLHGQEVAGRETQTSVIGHQHVLGPENRSSQKALEVAQRLLIKAAERLRGQRFFCRRLTLEVKFMHAGGYYVREMRFAETQDTMTLIAALHTLWSTCPNAPPLRVSVSLSGLVPEDAHQFSLFSAPRREGACRAVDAINRKYGRGTISFGLAPGAKSLTADKIAFSRVPELYEVASG